MVMSLLALPSFTAIGYLGAANFWPQFQHLCKWTFQLKISISVQVAGYRAMCLSGEGLRDQGQ